MEESAIRRVLDARHGHISALLAALGPDREADLAAQARLGHWSRGERIFAEGDATPEIAFLIDGVLGMSKRLPDGPSHIVGLLVPGDMFGGLDDEPLTYRVEALAESTALMFRRPAFEAAISSSLEAERLLLVAVLDELDAAREWLVLMGAHNAAERLAGFLLFLLRRWPGEGRAARGERLRLDLPLKRVDLARHLGVRPESLSRAFQRLQREGILRAETATSVVIDDPAALVALSGQDAAIPDVSSESGPGRKRKR